jgi:hypothetical protein
VPLVWCSVMHVPAVLSDMVLRKSMCLVTVCMAMPVRPLNEISSKLVAAFSFELSQLALCCGPAY